MRSLCAIPAHPLSRISHHLYELGDRIMELFMQNISFTATNLQLKTEIARIIHGPEYSLYSANLPHPVNLEVYILPRRQRSRGNAAPGRNGKLTLPSTALGERFLQEYGGSTPTKNFIIGTRVRFSRSKVLPRPDVVEHLRRHPYVDPTTVDDVEALDQRTRQHTVTVATLQFGWECRDNVFSIEWERDCDGGVSLGEVTFSNERREFRIEIPDAPGSRHMHVVAIRASQVAWASAGLDGRRRPIIYLTLGHAPSFESGLTTRHFNDSNDPRDALIDLMASLFSLQDPTTKPGRRRHMAFDASHSGVAAYSSNAIRLVCRDQADLHHFRVLCETGKVRVDDFIYPAEYRSLFSADVRQQYDEWVSVLAWPVAFQVEALARSLLFDMREIMSFRDRIQLMSLEKGVVFTAAFIRHLATNAKGWFWDDDEDSEGAVGLTDADSFFSHCLQHYAPPARPQVLLNTDTFECLHIVVTPTTIRLEGPYPERSNRVIRLYPRDHDSFLRVSFVDESNLHFRFDREVDGREFIHRRVGGILSTGLDIAGRHFDFLAYSQSALKDHAVWFVKPFIDGNGDRIDAATIVEGLGTFDRAPSDPRLIYCPARYGARISQAFTSTDPSISVEPGEINTLEDIKDATGQWCFTDGVGTISRSLAQEIWDELTRGRRRRGRRHCPAAFQIRFMGSKGMVSIDYKLSGRVICLRPSMIKFEAPSLREIEIARAFDKPGPFNLNRPLIMILEGLGVPFETFQTLQRDAVVNAQKSVDSLAQSARLLETYGLGGSFQLTSAMLSLDKLGLGPLFWDQFWNQMMTFAVHHVLRELKHHARIPVPNAWNLVGVADTHGYLKEGEIFVHIVNTHDESFYLDGSTMVSRSPSIHPGDVQIARAIGRPPANSPFARESLRNCIVFATRGKRPLPSCLGGGDLDGDLFGCTLLPTLLPRTTVTPALYTSAERKELNRPSTMSDVADFVTEYIYSDNLGIIAKTWLVLADLCDKSIFDEKCLQLSNLHSDAVDYPKTGKPVPLNTLPKLPRDKRPDWDAPETKDTAATTEYYESNRHIGRLFREIDLPALPEAQRVQNEQRRRIRSERIATLEEVLGAFAAPSEEEEELDPVRDAVEDRVLEFIAIGRHEEIVIAEVWDVFINYRSQLQTICADNTISHARNAMLTEEEAMVGTIVAKCTQPRMRKDMMSRLREQTSALVQSVAHQLDGEIGTLPEMSLERAWVAYRVSLLAQDHFGGKSFGWIALHQVFDAIKVIEAEIEGFF